MKKTIFILTLLLPICVLFAQYNKSYVDTHGNSNSMSFVAQESANGGYNMSDVDQLQDGNRVNVAQVNTDPTTGSWWDRNNSDIYQDGVGNYAVVGQIHGTIADATADTPSGGLLDADIKQLGDGNTAIVSQEGVNNFGTIRQNGNRGVAIQYQGKSWYFDAGTPTRYNDAYIWQGPNVDGGSRAEQYQEGTQNDAHIWQNSDNASKAVQIQVNDKPTYSYPIQDLNEAFIWQEDGGNNRAYQLQYYTDNGAERNYARVHQTGSDNYSQQVQFGGDNKSITNQTGGVNGVHVLQTSNGITTAPFYPTLPVHY